jgi:hypothetical protein
MSKINFTSFIDLANSPTPSSGYTIAYDLDGVLKQKDENGNILPIGPSEINVSEIIAGQGLTVSVNGTSFLLDTQVDNGISISDNKISLGGILSQNTEIFSNNYDLKITSLSNIGNTHSIDISSIGSNLNTNTQDGDIMSLGTSDNFSSLQVISDNKLSSIRILNIDQLLSNGDPSINNRMVIRDDFYSKGFVYASDYSNNFTNHSLVSKKYVDDQISAVPLGAAAGTEGQFQLNRGDGGFLEVGIFDTNNLNLTINNQSVPLGGTENTFYGINSGNNNTGSFNTFVGVCSGILNTTGIGNTFIGNKSGSSNTIGSLNTFIGNNTGTSNTSGVNNTFIGQNSGCSNTIGLRNVFIGTDSGRLSNSNDNTFIGFGSGYNNTIGSCNILIGNNSGYNNTTGTNNVFIGNGSGFNNTTGRFNTFIGQNTGFCNTGGSCNTFIGLNSGYLNTTGQNNTFIGMQSGVSNTIGFGNTFIGNQSGYLNTIGVFNTFIGINSGSFNTIGTNNTFIGRNSGCINTLGQLNTFIGSVSGTNNTTGSSNTYIGVNSGFFNTTGSNNTFIGVSSGFNNIESNNIFIGNLAGYNNTTGISNTFIGVSSGAIASISCAIAIGRCARPINDGDLAIGSTIAPINTTSTAGNITNYMCIIINGISYRMALYAEE